MVAGIKQFERQVHFVHPCQKCKFSYVKVGCMSQQLVRIKNMCSRGSQVKQSSIAQMENICVTYKNKVKMN